MTAEHSGIGVEFIQRERNDGEFAVIACRHGPVMLENFLKGARV